MMTCGIFSRLMSKFKSFKLVVLPFRFRINAALKETNKGEITRVDLCVPECEVSDKLYYLSFVIKNVSCFETKLHLKRKQICDCKQKQSNDSVTFRIKYFDCPHKDLFTMQIASSYFPVFIQSILKAFICIQRRAKVTNL